MTSQKTALRNLMRERQKERATERIKSPFAKVDDAGTVSCVLCGKIGTASVALFDAHLATSKHSQILKEQAQAMKREKKEQARKEEERVDEDVEEEKEEHISPPDPQPIQTDPPARPEPAVAPSADAIPANFFDNPDDAKEVRGIASDPLLADESAMNKELAAFEEAIKGDLETADDVEVEIDTTHIARREEEERIDTQNLSEGLKRLRDKRNEVAARVAQYKKAKIEEEEEEIDDDALEAFLSGDWRSKTT